MALSAAFLWAITGILSTGPVRKLGAVHFNLLRMAVVMCVLMGFAYFTGRISSPALGDVSTLMISGFFGIFLGDTLLFNALKKLGPRLTGLLFATNAPITFIAGIFILDDSYHWSGFVGMSLVFSGVAIAVFFKDSNKAKTKWDHQNEGWIWGAVAGLGAALFQSVGTLIAQPIIKTGFDPVFASAIRVSIGFLALLVTASSQGFLLSVYREKKLNPKDVLTIVTSGILGMGVGMTLLLWALDLAPAGAVAVLSATTPIMLLPILWIISKKKPNVYSLIGAVFVVMGTGLIFF